MQLFDCSGDGLVGAKIGLNSIFKKEKPIIGALHFAPLLGYKGFEGFERILENARSDARALEDGGVDGIIFENNYDLPHKVNVGPETVASMTYLCNELRKEISIPHGISVLWNDYTAALSVAKVTGGKFVRVPVFVDSVDTDFGRIIANPEAVTGCRSAFGMDDVAIFTDIQVKHATMLKERPVKESALEAERSGSDTIIVTGRWTGNAPEIAKIKEAKEAIKLDVIVGSGLDSKNASEILKYADGAIVSTALKEETSIADARNVKPTSARIDERKVKELIDVVDEIRS
jgi:hypothetical protein